MPNPLDTFLPRVKDLIQIGTRTVTAEDPGSFQQFRSGSLSCLLQLFGQQHPYFRDFESRVTSPFREEDIQAGLGIMEAVKKELEQGWLVTAMGLISADIFSDYLEMARHLLDEGYKDAAAVIAGSTLEFHLRQICHKNGIPVESQTGGQLRHKKADLLNSELAAAQVYGKLDQKGVTAWLDLRNNAAHGNYGAYTLEQVQLMIQSISDFIARNPL